MTTEHQIILQTVGDFWLASSFVFLILVGIEIIKKLKGDINENKTK